MSSWKPGDPLRSGCDPGYDDLPGGYPDWLGDGLAPGQAARIADAIRAEPQPGGTGAGPNEFDHSRDSVPSTKEGMRRANRRRPSGIPYGYGDERRQA